MPLTEEIIIYDLAGPQAAEYVKRAEIIFMLDFKINETYNIKMNNTVLIYSYYV